MTRLVSRYVAEFGPLNLFADALAIVSVFALLGIAFASPASVEAPETLASAADGAGRGEAR